MECQVSLQQAALQWEFAQIATYPACPSGTASSLAVVLVEASWQAARAISDVTWLWLMSWNCDGISMYLPVSEGILFDTEFLHFIMACLRPIGSFSCELQFLVRIC